MRRIEYFETKLCKRRKILQASRFDVKTQLAGENPLTPMPPSSGKLRSYDPRERKQMSEKYKICLRLDEKERLENDARRCELSKNAYLRRLITGSVVWERPNQEIGKLRAEIHRIGNNINQFTRTANTTGADERDVRRIQESMNQVYELMYRIGRR